MSIIHNILGGIIKKRFIERYYKNIKSLYPIIVVGLNEKTLWNNYYLIIIKNIIDINLLIQLFENKEINKNIEKMGLLNL